MFRLATEFLDDFEALEFLGKIADGDVGEERWKPKVMMPPEYGSASTCLFDFDQCVRTSFLGDFLHALPCLSNDLNIQVTDHIGEIKGIGEYVRAATDTKFAMPRCPWGPPRFNVATRTVHTCVGSTRFMHNRDDDNSRREATMSRTVMSRMIVGAKRERGIPRVRASCCHNPLSCV